MNINFLDDLKNEIIKAFEDNNIPIPTAEKLIVQNKRSKELKYYIVHNYLEDLLNHFFTVKSRLIPIIKWNVHISDKLSNCEEIQDIVYKLENGQDINNLLSKKVKKINQAKNPDQLKYEWGIYHLHFKESRTSDLLFIYFSGNNAYLIDILGHENPNSAIPTWTNTNLIQILHDNWPQVIMSKIFQKNSNTPILTIKQRRNLRKNSGNTTIVVSDRTEYLPLGGGFTTSNHPILSRFKTDSLIQKVINLEKIVPANIDIIKKELINMTTKPNLKLKLDDNFQPIIIEETHNIVLNLKLNKGF